MNKKMTYYKLIAILVAYIILMTIYKDGDHADFNNFMKHATSLGYPIEEHFVETEDGFIISIHRIKGKNSTSLNEDEVDLSSGLLNNNTEFQIKSSTNLKKKYPILMGHGLGGSSDVFIRNTEEKSIGFFLANKGYDVFIMNSRGNIYSNQHKKYKRDSIEYWDFSFQEMAKYDLPAVSAYILEKIYNTSTKDQSEDRTRINYIGHSQGCTIVLASLSEEYVPSHFFENVVLMTPAALTKNVNSFLGNLIKQYDILGTLRNFGMHQFFQMNTLNYYVCRAIPFVCSYTVSIATDSSESPINYDLFYQLMYHYPAGTSTKAYLHFNQLMKAGKFQLFDYGTEKNLQVYNKTSPPEIRLNNIKNNIHIIAGSEDIATPLVDIYDLKSQLVNAKNVTVVQYNEGHCSFILGRENEYLHYIPQVLQ